MTGDPGALARRRGDCGIDAPYALRYLALAAVGLLAVSIATTLGGLPGIGTATAWGAVVTFLSVAIVDISASGEYAERLRARGMAAVSRHPLGWEAWFGGPWVAASLVTARKPA